MSGSTGPRFFVPESLAEPSSPLPIHSAEGSAAVLAEALTGLDLDEASASDRALMREIMNDVDPLEVIIPEHGNDDEYDPEVDHLIALANAGRLTDESAWAVFGYWFGYERDREPRAWEEVVRHWEERSTPQPYTRAREVSR